jgi:hypothetical protein
MSVFAPPPAPRRHRRPRRPAPPPPLAGLAGAEPRTVLPDFAVVGCAASAGPAAHTPSPRPLSRTAATVSAASVVVFIVVFVPCMAPSSLCVLRP